MSKSFSNDQITNELKGSAWFRHPDGADAPTSDDVSDAHVPSPTKAPESDGPEAPQTDPSTPETQPARTLRTQERTVQVYETVARTNSSSVHQPEKTRKIRRAYDFLDHQLSALHRIRATRELSSSKAVPMSELVREAVDLLIAKEGLD